MAGKGTGMANNEGKRAGLYYIGSEGRKAQKRSQTPEEMKESLRGFFDAKGWEPKTHLDHAREIAEAIYERAGLPIREHDYLVTWDANGDYKVQAVSREQYEEAYRLCTYTDSDGFSRIGSLKPLKELGLGTGREKKIAQGVLASLGGWCIGEGTTAHWAGEIFRKLDFIEGQLPRIAESQASQSDINMIFIAGLEMGNLLKIGEIEYGLASVITAGRKNRDSLQSARQASVPARREISNELREQRREHAERIWTNKPWLTGPTHTKRL